MTLKAQLQADIITAMKARETAKIGTLRLLSAAIKQREVDDQIELDDAQVLAIVEKACKQRKESIAQFLQAGRQDLVDIEQAELHIISAYLPAQMSEADVNAAVAKAIIDSGAAGAADMGKVIALLKPQLAGKADMGKVSGLVKTALNAL